MTDPISSSSGPGGALGQSTTGKSIADNFNTFLQLLTTQLKNQNPLSPLDTNQFTQQLVQFSSVEQQLKTNTLLNSLVTSNNVNRAASAAGYIGATITADGSTTTFKNGQASWNWSADKASPNAVVSIIDSTGSTVYSQHMDLKAGPGGYTWDGRTNNGSFYTGGTFTIRVDAQDAAGKPVNVSTEISGKVDAVDLSGTTPLLMIGSTGVPLDKVKTLKKLAG